MPNVKPVAIVLLDTRLNNVLINKIKLVIYLEYTGSLQPIITESLEASLVKNQTR